MAPSSYMAPGPLPQSASRDRNVHVSYISLTLSSPCVSGRCSPSLAFGKERSKDERIQPSQKGREGEQLKICKDDCVLSSLSH
jgi:hypothetical protein